MLQEMRKYTKSWISSIFLGGLALSFAIWGIADIFRGRPDNIVYSIGSTEVPIELFQREYQNATRRMGVTLPPEQAKLLGDQVLEHMTLGTALDNLADSLGLTASDARIRDEIQNTQAFNGALGAFDHDTFLNIIRRAGFQENEYIAVTRKDIARGQMLRAIEGGFSLPPPYARAIISFLREGRAAQYVVLTPAMAGDIAPPSDAVLAAYVKAHPERFSTPEYRNVSIASVGADDLAPSMPVTEKLIADELESNRADYIVDEKRVLEKLSFNSEDEAKAAKAALDGGKTFAALAAERKLKPSDYQLGELIQADLSIDPAQAKAAFSLPEGGISAPVKGNFGWLLLHVVKVTPGSAKSHDDIKKAVQRKLALSKIVDIANSYTDSVGGGAEMNEAARKAGMHYVRVAAVDSHGLGPDGAKVTAADNDELLAAIFKAEVGEDSDPFSTKDGHTYVIKVEGVTPPQLKSLDAVRAEATQDWIAEQRLVKLRDKASALAAAATKAKSLTGAAAALGLPVLSSPALSRDTNKDQFTTGLVTALFKAPANGTVFQPTADGGYIVAQVSGIVHPMPANTDMQFLQGVNELSSAIASDITTTLAKAEQQHEGIDINHKLVDNAVGGNPGSGS